MAVVGIDFGTLNCTVAATQKGGVDILTDEVSSRQTPNMVGFTDKERALGQAALSQYTRNTRNTLANLKLLLGRRWSESDVQHELKGLPFKAVELPGDEIGVQVMYCNETKVFSVTALVGMMLQKLRAQAAENLGKEVKDVVISVPMFWTDNQRLALLDASRVAGLNCLRLINDNTASALGYGLFKRDLPAGDEANPALYSMFIDMGYSQTSVSVVALSQGKQRTVSTSWDSQLGGRSFDKLLVEHVAGEIKAKYKLDVLNNQRALMRLETACERVKKQLNMNPDVPLSVDSLMNDVDVKMMISRAPFEQLIQPLLARFVEPVRQALEQTGISADKLTSVEITGGGTRLFAVQNALTDYLKQAGFQHALSRALNHEESVAKGCALQCAVLSPLFRLQREYAVQDITSYPVRVQWGTPSASDTMELGSEAGAESLDLPAGTVFPTGKKLTMTRREPLQVVASYAPSPLLPPQTPTLLGHWLLDVKQPEGVSEALKLTLTVRVDLNMNITVDSAQLSIPLPDEPSSEPPAAAQATPPAAEPVVGDSAAAGESKPDEKAGQAPAAKKTKRVRHQPVEVREQQTATLATAALEQLKEEEGRMQAADRLAKETADTKNLVETYVYDTRGKLAEGGEWHAFASQADRDALSQLLDRTENWLYDEGQDQTKSVYASKLSELQSLGNPIKQRAWEASNRYDAVAQLRAAIDRLSGEANSNDVKYEHIDVADKQRVVAETAKASASLNDALSKQEASLKTQNPQLTVADLMKRKQELTSFCEAILNKPKPKPVEKPAEKPVEKPAEKPASDNTEAKQTGNPSEKSQEADQKEESKTSAADPAVPSAMDLD